MADSEPPKLVYIVEDPETESKLYDDLRPCLENKNFKVELPSGKNFGLVSADINFPLEKDQKAFVIFLWTKKAAENTNFLLHSLIAERTQIEQQKLRCINVLLEEGIKIDHIKQKHHKLPHYRKGMAELAEGLHEIMKDPNSSYHQRVGNVAEGLVWNYVVVYLKAILDKEAGYWSQFKCQESCQNGDRIQNRVQPYILIIPKSGKCPNEFGEYLKQDDHCELDRLEELKMNDAGIEGRRFTATIHSLCDKQRNKSYYFLGEFANPVNTIYQMQDEQEGLISLEQRKEFVEHFTSRLKYILNHEHVGLKDTYRIIELDDVDENGKFLSEEKVGEKLKASLLEAFRGIFDDGPTAMDTT